MPVPTRLSSACLRHGVYAALWALCMAAASPAFGQSPREWRDYAGGPDSSRFVATTQITKDNVHRLQAAWTYPAGQTDFNPLIVRNVVYAIATGDAFVALDASNGQELWRQPGLGSFAVRGINYWESADGADRRLLFVHNNFLQALERQGIIPRPVGAGGPEQCLRISVGLTHENDAVLRVLADYVARPAPAAV